MIPGILNGKGFSQRIKDTFMWLIDLKKFYVWLNFESFYKLISFTLTRIVVRLVVMVSVFDELCWAVYTTSYELASVIADIWIATLLNVVDITDKVGAAK